MIIYGLSYIKNQFNSVEFEIGINENKISCIEYKNEYLAKNNMKKALFCNTLSEVLKSNAALCEYIIPNINILKDSVLLAEKYLFDSKILTLATNDEAIVKAANVGVDCVLIKEFDEKYKEYFIG
ncbi:hypothetical protein AVANS14531_08590 [Campylobacter sp. Cr9]|uniref:hypothetical protein n=1 Tax=Campylobacter sp. Cr9 TaxID=2735728 RepID=UPI003014C91F|nr:hypothetical protein [Campylobacter sp. Cr9]